MNIFAIGSCRIHTPLDRARLPVNKGADCFVGLCHSTKEVIQKIQYANGDLTIPKKLLPLVDTRKNANSRNDHFNSSNANIVFIEISSLKEFALFKYYLQSDRVHNLMQDSNFSGWCANESAEGLEINECTSPFAKNIARFLRVTKVSQDEFMSDIVLISENFRMPIVFLGHVYSKSMDEKVVASRSLLNSMLKVAARHSGAYYLDVSKIVDFYGASVALQDANHWSRAFEPIAGYHFAEAAYEILSARRDKQVPWLFRP